MMPNSNTVKTFNMLIEKVTSFSDYQPKNNKVFCYPYNYLKLTNNIGNENIYKYEMFENNPFTFDIECAVSIGCSIRAVPKNYKGAVFNYDETIPLAKYPTGAWSGDAFTNWLTQNSVDIIKNLVPSAIVTSAALATMNPVTIGAAVMSASSSIGGLLGQFRDAKLQSPITGGHNDGDVNFSAGKNTFIWKHMRCKLENLKAIDDYFTRYGYKIIRVVNPNITGRTYWNYVEIGSSEEIGFGDVPSKYMEEINKACRKGVTIWHSHDNVGNFNLNNTIVT